MEFDVKFCDDLERVWRWESEWGIGNFEFWVWNSGGVEDFEKYEVVWGGVVLCVVGDGSDFGKLLVRRLVLRVLLWGVFVVSVRWNGEYGKREVGFFEYGLRGW